MSNIKKLPVKLPEIDLYPHHAHLLAILEGLELAEEVKLAWFCNNYLQVEVNKDAWKFDFATGIDFIPILNNCPWLIKDSLSREMISLKWENFWKFVIDALNLNNYIYVEVDEFYISPYKNYKKNHHIHTLMIFGYDLERRIFNIADFFKNKKYYFAEASFSEIEAGYLNTPPREFLCGIYLYKKSNRYYKYEYNRANLVYNINAFLNSEDSKKYNMFINYPQVNSFYGKIAFGLEAYQEMQDMVIENNHIDTRILVLFLAHNIVIKYIMEGLFKKRVLDYNDDLYQRIKNNVELCKGNLMGALRYNLNYIPDRKKLIVNVMNQVKNEEEYILRYILKNLKVEAGFRKKLENCNIFNIYNGLEISNACANEEGYSIEKCGTVQAIFYGSSVVIYGMFKNRDCKIMLDDELVNIESMDEKIVIDNLLLGYHIVKLIAGQENIFFKRLECKTSLSAKKIQQKVELLGYDYQTKGSWNNKYGTAGYIIPGMESSQATNIEVKLPALRTFTNEIEDRDYLLSDGKGQKVKKCFFTNSAINIELYVTGNHARKVSLYFFNWSDIPGISGRLIVKEPEYNKELFNINLKDLYAGGYISFEVLGHYIFTIVMEVGNREYADLYGIFFD